jgi:hypothetical protein
MRLLPSLVAALLAVSSFSDLSHAESARHAKVKKSWAKPLRRPDRDCVPINGRFGYYGNPWCDTGSTRPPDLDFRGSARQQGR